MKIFKNRNFLPILSVIFFAVLAGRSLIFQSGYFNMHDDLQMMRQLELEKCFQDGQIPCRWVPDMGYGFGFPLFNFYPPLPYLIGQIFRILGFTFVTTAKLTFALSFVVSGLSMYFLSKQFFGRLGGVLSGIMYIWAPYHAVDVYVRGAMNEAWALAWFPIIFLSAYKIITDRENIKKWFVLLVLSYAFLFLTHNLMVIIFTPFFALWVLIHLWLEGKWKRTLILLLAGVWALGIAAFFTLPALSENKFTQVETQLRGYYDYTAHFVSLNQLLFSRFWGYGPSVWVEADDKMSFQIGHVHWILSIFIGFLLVLRLKHGEGTIVERIKKDKLLLVTSFVFLMGWFSAFMTHLRSIFIYQAIPPLGYIQFSWRFLTLVIFALSFIAGYLPGVLHSKKRFINLATLPFRAGMVLLLALIVLLLNWNYFTPEHGKLGKLTDEEKFTGAAWDLQQTAGIYDYLPVYAKEAPKGPQKSVAEVMEGQARVDGFQQGTYWGLFIAKVESDKSKIRINIFKFPGWKVFIKEGNSMKEVENFVPDEEKWGRMWIELPKGEHAVYTQLYNTPIRTVGNIITLLSVILLLVLLRKKNLNFKSLIFD